MNVEPFSEASFDAATWINTSFRNAHLQNKEALVLNLVTKLQLYVQQMNVSLEDTMQHVLSGMTPTVKDARNLLNTAIEIRSKILETQSEITQVQRKTGACMANLERLDSLKTKLKFAKQGLQESDGWGRLTTDLDDCFEQNNTLLACEKLLALQRSLAAQEGLPGQTERETHVEGFKNRLEALASPAIVNCFSTGDIDQSATYVKMFSEINRLPQLAQYYRTVQKNMLQQQWSQIIEFSNNSNSTRFLQELYDLLSENFQKQTKWCSQVFGGEGCIEPIYVLIELLSSLQPTRDAEILNALKQTSDKLIFLFEFSKANVAFGVQLQFHLDELQIKPTKKLMNRLSNEIFHYFDYFILQYTALEQSFLGSQLAKLTIIQNTSAETIRLLGNANCKVFDWIKKSIDRCEQITQNCALGSLITVVNSFLVSFLEVYKKAQQQLNASKSTEHDWSSMQMSITLLQNIGAFKLLLNEIEEIFATKILKKSQDNEDLDNCIFKYRINGIQELKEFNRLASIAKDRNSDTYPGDTLTQDSKGLFSMAKGLLKPTCEFIHDTTLASVFAPIENHFKAIEPPQSILNATSNLPDYSFTPQEFITEIGQYLLTLPQHLEPLLLLPGDSLKAALNLCDDRYCKNISSADVLLSLIAEECCAIYQDQIGKIHNANDASAKQIATDIQYLGSVFEELGLSLGQNLQQTALLLRTPKENYLALSNGCDPELVTSIRQIRNVVSIE